MADRADFSNRTWLCTVVFLDMAAYSQRSVTQQMAMKRRFNARLAEAIAHVAVSDRIVLDTGDGAALCFMGDPEDALLVALRLLHAFRDEATSEAVPVIVRIGIHIGPVKIMKDINGQLNTIGDGVNTAQRVMAFAQPDQILVSRSFYEVVACLSHEYAQMFQYLGPHTDKHVREHVLYAVVVPPGRTTMEALPGQLLSRAQPSHAVLPVWEPDFLAQVEAALGKYMGPVARMLVARAAQRTADVTVFGDILAAHIAPEHERSQFLDTLTALPGALAMPEATSAYLYDALHAEAFRLPFSAPAAPPVVPVWEPQVLQAAQQRLAYYLGPMAGILVQRAAQQASSPEAFYRLLAEYLTTAEEKQRFLHDSGVTG